MKDPNKVPQTDKLVLVCQDAGFTKVAQEVQFFGTIVLGELGIIISCREHTHLRDDYQSHPKGVVAGCAGHSTVWPTRIQDQHGFSGIRWIRFLGRHQQGC